MRLASSDGSFVDIQVTRYQYPSVTGDGSGRDWDANWLVVRGEVRDGARVSNFEDPCLTTFEARQLGEWLKGVASGEVQPRPYEDDNDVKLLVFTEPNIALNLAERSDQQVTVRVYLSLEAQPAWAAEDERGGIFGYYIPVQMSVDAVVAAAAAWNAELLGFPQR